jgi:hypothetical protein
VTPSSELRRALAKLGLDAHAELLAPFATLELGLVPDGAAAHALGGTRLGGAPDLPHEFAWPCHSWPLAEVAGWPDDARAEVDVARDRGQVRADGDRLVMPLAFLLQIDLATIDDPRLPGAGVLAFFASVTTDVPDPLFAKRVAAHVAFAADPSALVPRAHPPTCDAPPAPAVALRVEPAIRWNIPFEEMPRLEAALPSAAFDALVRSSQRNVHALFPAPADECVGPMPPFGDVAVLRLHAEPSVGFSVGDAAWLTFTIPELDLRARRFGAARASVFIG